MRHGLILVLLSSLIAAELRVDPKEEALVAKRRNFWSFRAPVRPELPAGVQPIDFLSPAEKPLLERRAVIRRLTLDLTGLLPRPAEVETFLKDKQPGAYERLVDRLMATPHYGERWGQKWLDVVRYADTNGYELDADRPHAWRYRDYVIRSFNEKKPYDRFVKEQVAGDELYPGNKDALIATGFLRAGPQHVVGGNQDLEMNRQEELIEMTHAVSSGLLGLTVGCARCHNHKFDPILQSDYYRLQAILAPAEFAEVSIANKEETAAAEAAIERHKALLKPILDEIKAIEEPYRKAYREEKKKLLEPEFLAVLAIDKDKLNAEQKRLRKEAEGQISPTWDAVVALIPPDLKAKRRALRERMHQINLDEPDPVPHAYAVKDMDKAPETHILKTGDHKSKLAPVGPGLPLVLSPDLGKVPESPKQRRAALAEWLVNGQHPLTARVMVNRIWQFRMGKGIVTTMNDYGALGAKPSNAKLLDFLATEFVSSGWNIQHIDRLILTSKAYQQQAAQRRRMDAEQLRDSLLSLSGMLNLKMYGKPVKTPIEPEIYDIIFTEGEPDNLWPLPKDRTEMYRRSIYVENKRSIRLPALSNFDQPDTLSSCPERPVSTHALQGLTMLNSDFLQEQSKAFGRRIQEGCKSKDCAVRQAYSLALNRLPNPKELQLARTFFQKGGTIEDFALALVNRNDFVYLP
jgi:hypothetical protein